MEAVSTEDVIDQMQEFLGGQISNCFGEYILNVNSKIGRGSIKFITFERGVSVADFDMNFHEDILLIEKVNHFNPIHFSYCSKGYYEHRYKNEEQFQTTHKFHSVISTAKKGIDHHLLFPKNLRIRTNNIQIARKEFQNKAGFRSFSMLNIELYETFTDHTDASVFIHYAPINIQMEEHVKAIWDSDSQGIMRILQIEAISQKFSRKNTE